MRASTDPFSIDYIIASTLTLYFPQATSPMPAHDLVLLRVSKLLLRPDQPTYSDNSQPSSATTAKDWAMSRLTALLFA